MRLGKAASPTVVMRALWPPGTHLAEGAPVFAGGWDLNLDHEHDHIVVWPLPLEPLRPGSAGVVSATPAMPAGLSLSRGKASLNCSSDVERRPVETSRPSAGYRSSCASAG